MRHGFKKPKFGQGKDADRALMRKLIVNFLMAGKIKTTLVKARALRPEVERLVGKIKAMSQADRNNLLNKFGDLKALEDRFKDIRQALASISSGYTRIVKLVKRASDGAEVGELSWAYPVILTTKTKTEMTPEKPKTEKESKVAKKETKK